ncbi:MAG: hypothetical protein IPL65_11350 [Lewinellaceae bacterium]|nr:hypothetical protein [Lewinellaceae bacterium]
MKRYTGTLLFGTMLLIWFTLSSLECKKDKTPDRDKLLGTYSVVETCGAGNDSYNIRIVEVGTAQNEIVIVNLYDARQQWRATVSGDQITIPTQAVDAVTWSGSGTIAGNALNISFTGSVSGIPDNCTAICTRK